MFRVLGSEGPSFEPSASAEAKSEGACDDDCAGVVSVLVAGVVVVVVEGPLCSLRLLRS